MRLQLHPASRPQTERLCLRCKLCHRNVPAGVETFLFNGTIVVARPLCSERRHYLPSDVFLEADCKSLIGSRTRYFTFSTQESFGAFVSRCSRGHGRLRALHAPWSRGWACATHLSSRAFR